MRLGKIIKIGDSMAVVIPRSNLRALGWVRGDVLWQEIENDALIFRNVRKPVVTMVHTVKDYGDRLSK